MISEDVSTAVSNVEFSINPGPGQMLPSLCIEAIVDVNSGVEVKYSTSEIGG